MSKEDVMGTNQSKTQTLCVRLPVSINNMIDKAVLRQREETGRRVTRTEVIIDLVIRYLATPEKPQGISAV